MSSAFRTYLPPRWTIKGNNNSLYYIRSLLDDPDQFKGGLLVLDVGVFVRWSLHLGGSIVSLNGKFSSKLCMYVYVQSYVHHRGF